MSKRNIKFGADDSKTVADAAVTEPGFIVFVHLSTDLKQVDKHGS